MSTLCPTKVMSWRYCWRPGKYIVGAASCALLKPGFSHSCVDLPGFTLKRSDRDVAASGKLKCGGLALFVNQRSCSYYCQRADVSRYWTIGSWSETMPWNKSIQSYHNKPCAHSTQSNCDVVREAVARIQTKHPETLIIISGDFIHVTLSSHLTGFTVC